MSLEIALAIAGIAFTILFGWLALRHRAPRTTNTATGSERVRQKGGKGTTTNSAKDSADVDQSG